MRRGAWDIDERVKDMDLNGIYASLNFPSFLPGFAGQRLQQVTNDRDLALASVRAWNDWHHDVWAGSHPGPDHSVPVALAAGPRARRGDDPRKRRAWISCRHVQREPGDAGIAEHPLRPLGSDDGRVRRNRHRREPAHRIVGFVAVHHRRRAAGCAGRAVLRLRHLGGGRLAVLRICPADSPISRSVCPRAESAGSRDCWIASTTCSATTRCMAPGRRWGRT